MLSAASFHEPHVDLLPVGPDCETLNPYFPLYYYPGNGAVVGSGQIPIAASNSNNNNDVGGEKIHHTQHQVPRGMRCNLLTFMRACR